jgi:hypothetical protein
LKRDAERQGVKKNTEGKISMEYRRKKSHLGTGRKKKK